MNKQEKIFLDNSQCTELAVLGFVNINGQILFKKRRYNTVLQAEEFEKPGDVIAQSKYAVFILNPNQHESVTIKPSLALPSKVYL